MAYRTKPADDEGNLGRNGSLRQKKIVFHKRINLCKVDAKILKAVNKKIDALRTNVLYGQSLQKRLIPEAYRRTGFDNLFRIELPGGWRMLYTLIRDDEDILVFVLDLLNHKKYERLFGYG